MAAVTVLRAGSAGNPYAVFFVHIHNKSRTVKSAGSGAAEAVANAAVSVGGVYNSPPFLRTVKVASITEMGRRTCDNIHHSDAQRGDEKKPDFAVYGIHSILFGKEGGKVEFVT